MPADRRMPIGTGIYEITDIRGAACLYYGGQTVPAMYTFYRKVGEKVPAPPRPKTLVEQDQEKFKHLAIANNWDTGITGLAGWLAGRASLREELLQSLRDESMYMQTGAYNRLTALLKGEQ